MEETMEGLDDEDLEEEADEEVDKVLFELTDGKLGQAGRVGGALPVSTTHAAEKLTKCRQKTRRRARPRHSACRRRCRISSVDRAFSCRMYCMYYHGTSVRNAVYIHV